MKKIVLGLSGGVDSAVCGKMLHEQGYEVTGVYLDNGCGDVSAAREVAANLGIAFRAVDMRAEIHANVIEPFVAGYLRGETPIPCILCNPAVKFKLLLAVADEIGAQCVATGHYAVIKERANGEFCMYKSKNENDQSYMLYRVPQEWLGRIKFPLGELPSKTQTRQMAAVSGIDIANKPDSMEICFIPNGDYAKFIEENAHIKPLEGDFVDEDGNVLGRHKGIHCYTVGQRRGLGISAETRIFVQKIDVENNRVVVSKSDPHCEEIFVHSLCKTASGFGDSAFEADVKIRHSNRQEHAIVQYLENNRAKIAFAKPARAPSKGQSAVFYQDDMVIGGGFIE